MAERIAYLQAVVGADISSFRYAMGQVRDELGILGTNINRVSNAARTATFALSAPLAVMGGGFVSAASEFDAAMRNINSMALLTERELEALGTEILDYAQEVRAGGTALAEALAVVYSSGITDQQQAMELMQYSVKTAEAGLASVEATTEALVGSVQAFSNVGMGAERAANALVRLFQEGVGTMGEFGTAIAKLNPLFASLGIEIEEGYAHLAFLTQRGLQAGTASTYLRQALTQLLKPSEDLKNAFRALGVDGAEELIEQTGGLGQAFRALIGTTDGSATAINRLFRNIRGAQAVQQFANDLDALDNVIVRFTDNIDKALEQSWQEQMKSFAAGVDLLRSAWEKFSIVMGNALMPIVRPIIDGLTEILRTASELDDQTLRLAAAFGAVAVVVPPLVWLFTSMLNPVGLLSGAVVALAGAFMTDFAGIRTTVVNTINHITGGLDGLFSIVQRILHGAFNETAIPTFEEWLEENGPTVPRKIGMGAPGTVEFTVGDGGQSLYDFWAANLQEQISWDQLLQEYVIEPGRDTGIGETFVINLGDPEVKIGTPKLVMDSIMNSDMRGDFQSQLDTLSRYSRDVTLMEQSNNLGFFGRLAQQIEAELPALKAEVNRIFNQAVTVVIDEFNAVMSGINQQLSGNTETYGGTAGETPFYNRVRDLFNIDIPQLQSDVTAALEGDKPQILGTASQMLATIGQWITDVGLPTFSRTAGYLVGRFVYVILDAFEALPLLVEGVIGNQEGSQLGGILEDSILNPMFEGMGQAAQDAGVANLGDAFKSALEGFIQNLFSVDIDAAVITTIIVGSGFLGLIGRGLSGAFAAQTAVDALAPAGSSMAKTFLGSFATAFAAEQSGTVVGKVGSALADAFKKARSFGSGVPAALGGLLGRSLGALVIPLGKLSLVVGTLMIAADLIHATFQDTIGDPVRGAVDSLEKDPETGQPILGPQRPLTEEIFREDVVEGGLQEAFGPIFGPVVDTLFGDNIAATLGGGELVSEVETYANLFKQHLQTYIDAEEPVDLSSLLSEAPAQFQESISQAFQSNPDMFKEAFVTDPDFETSFLVALSQAIEMDDTSALEVLIPIALKADLEDMHWMPSEDALKNDLQALLDIKERDPMLLELYSRITITNTNTAIAIDQLTGELELLDYTFDATAPANAMIIAGNIEPISFDEAVRQMVQEFEVRNPVVEVPVTASITPVNIQGGGGGGADFGEDVEGRAKGGPVRSGTPYIVGEQGPELFMPNSPGWIMNNQDLESMGGTQNNYITIQGVQDVDKLISELRRRGIYL